MIPWEILMRFGLGTQQLPPSEFWAMTLREISAAGSAFEPGKISGFPRRDEIEKLILKYPDNRKEQT